MTRRRLSPEQRKEELLDAASALALESGVDGLGLEQVAERAGCSRNLAYTYFPNRAELVDVLAERERRRFVELMLVRIPRPATFDEWMHAWVAADPRHRGGAGPALRRALRRARSRPGPAATASGAPRRGGGGAVDRVARCRRGRGGRTRSHRRRCGARRRYRGGGAWGRSAPGRAPAPAGAGSAARPRHRILIGPPWPGGPGG